MYETKNAHIQNSLLTILPNNFVWVVGIIGLMLFCHASHKKMLINLLVAKGLFEAYTIVVKNVQERDALDLALPYLTLFQRIFLADYVFAVLFTMIG